MVSYLRSHGMNVLLCFTRIYALDWYDVKCTKRWHIYIKQVVITLIVQLPLNFINNKTIFYVKKLKWKSTIIDAYGFIESCAKVCEYVNMRVCACVREIERTEEN